MTPPGDPYRVLGVAPGASPDEVRCAYRRLAKRYHPDSAGAAASGWFLVVQAAYEAIVHEPSWHDAPIRRRPAGGPGSARPSAGPGSTAPGSTAPASSGPSARPRRPGARPGTRGEEGRPSQPPAGTASPDGGVRGRRGARTARPGSTSYDEAEREAAEPSWQGATWYGQSSGTYWTINPREYADPRKHGPEYLARGRPASRSAADDPDGHPAGSPVERPARGVLDRLAAAAGAMLGLARPGGAAGGPRRSGPRRPSGGR